MEILQLLFAIVQIAVGTATLVVQSLRKNFVIWDMRYRASLMKKRNQTKKLRSLMHRQKEELGKASDKVCLIQMRS